MRIGYLEAEIARDKLNKLILTVLVIINFESRIGGFDPVRRWKPSIVTWSNGGDGSFIFSIFFGISSNFLSKPETTISDA